MREKAGGLSQDELCSYQGGKPFCLAADFLVRWLIWCEWEIKKIPIEILDLLLKHWRSERPEGTERNRPQRKQSQFCPMHFCAKYQAGLPALSTCEKGHPFSSASSTKLWWNFSLPCKNSHFPGTDLLFTLSLWLDPHEANETLRQSEDLLACHPFPLPSAFPISDFYVLDMNHFNF